MCLESRCRRTILAFRSFKGISRIQLSCNHFNVNNVALLTEEGYELVAEKVGKKKVGGVSSLRRKQHILKTPILMDSFLVHCTGW